MSNEIPSVEELKTDLASIVAKSFPKTCVCGRKYDNLDDLIEKTGPTNYPSNILHKVGYGDESLVSLSRECECGGTLLVVVNDRRDQSAVGIQARQRFGDILDKLERTGIGRNAAREEVLNILAGKESRLLTHREIESTETIHESAAESVETTKAPDSPAPQESPPASPTKCQGQTKAGAPCKLLAMPGSEFCQMHGGKKTS